jgi:hypothetical protein
MTASTGQRRPISGKVVIEEFDDLLGYGVPVDEILRTVGISPGAADAAFRRHQRPDLVQVVRTFMKEDRRALRDSA